MYNISRSSSQTSQPVFRIQVPSKSKIFNALLKKLNLSNCLQNCVFSNISACLAHSMLSGLVGLHLIISGVDIKGSSIDYCNHSEYFLISLETILDLPSTSFP